MKRPLALALSLSLLCGLAAAPVFAADNPWSSHYSLESAKDIQQSRLWEPMRNGHLPHEPMTKQEAFALLHQAVGKTAPSSTGDVTLATRSDLAHWLAELTQFNTGIAYRPASPFADTTALGGDDAFAYVYYSGLMLGDGEKFYPARPLQRGDLAIVLQRVLERMPQMASSMEFEGVAEPLPETVYTLVQENKEKEGLYTVSENGHRYLVVCAGEQSTGGYSVKVERVMETEKAIYVQVTKSAPRADMNVIQVLTYPYQVVKISDTQKEVYLLP